MITHEITGDPQFYRGASCGLTGYAYLMKGREMFDEQPDSDPHGECAAEIHRLGIDLKIKTEEHDCCAEDLLAANKEISDLIGALKFLANSREPDAVDYAFSVLQKVGDGGTAHCSWWEGDDGGPWATQCNELFNLTEGTPTENGMRFCCFCGKVMHEIVAYDDF